MIEQPFVEWVFSEMRKAFIRAFEALREITDSAFHAQKEIEKDQKIKQTWIVPYDTRRESQVPKANVSQIRIRSDL